MGKFDERLEGEKAVKHKAAKNKYEPNISKESSTEKKNNLSFLDQVRLGSFVVGLFVGYGGRSACC